MYEGWMMMRSRKGDLRKRCIAPKYRQKMQYERKNEKKKSKKTGNQNIKIIYEKDSKNRYRTRTNAEEIKKKQIM